MIFGMIDQVPCIKQLITVNSGLVAAASITILSE